MPEGWRASLRMATCIASLSATRPCAAHPACLAAHLCHKALHLAGAQTLRVNDLSSAQQVTAAQAESALAAG